ncbi:MAG: pyridoxamine 5'-phosphate oxidase [Halieaceae bacterium]
MSYEDFRREYVAGGLSRDMLAVCPIEQFKNWLQQALDAGMDDPTAMSLATVDSAGCPWQRIVLLKDVSVRGFVFYTNHASAKAEDIALRPPVSLLFPWNSLDRQVIVSGTASKMSGAESARYFLTRPRESQLAAWASRQSKTISTRVLLQQQMQAMREKFGNGEIPAPDFWGGYHVMPERIEFWQGGEHRLHDRYRYTKAADDSWNIQQLQP